MNTNPSIVVLPGVAEAVARFPNETERGVLSAYLFGGFTLEQIAGRARVPIEDIRLIFRAARMKFQFHFAQTSPAPARGRR